MALDDDIKKLINKITALHLDLSAIDIPRLMNKITALHIDGVTPLLNELELYNGNWLEDVGAEYENHLKHVNDDMLKISHKYTKINKVSESWYPFIDFNNQADFYDKKNEKWRKIDYWQTVNVRELLGLIERRKGYPVKFANHVSYYSGVSLWVPDGWKVHSEYTEHFWISRREMRWREVIIYWVGQENVRLIEKFIPTTLESFAMQFVADNPDNTRRLKIFENMLFYNTISDNLIIANWDKIVQKIEDEMR